jgi:hypothetical protein
MTTMKAGRVLSQVWDFFREGRERLGRRERRGPEDSVGGGMKFGRMVSVGAGVWVEEWRRGCCRR